MARSRLRRSGPAPQRTTTPGHVMLVTSAEPSVRPSGDWDQMEVMLSAWKVQSLLAEATGHLAALQRLAGDTEPTGPLQEACRATEGALAAVRELVADSRLPGARTTPRPE